MVRKYLKWNQTFSRQKHLMYSFGNVFILKSEDLETHY